ncbi:hypothetical protein BaRGS_00040588 [Batillaria attramentaria]|uniref:Uncharacterized protein n=1 Tax=Batillaria attramentaria TaxID=370345 RepID=A0ABD0IYQ4_9CAEN
MAPPGCFDSHNCCRARLGNTFISNCCSSQARVTFMGMSIRISYRWLEAVIWTYKTGYNPEWVFRCVVFCLQGTAGRLVEDRCGAGGDGFDVLIQG